MSLPTVAELCRTLGQDLVPASGFGAPSLEVSAVHVSELADPTPYLSGGELLLTTGLSLVEDDAPATTRYVERLRNAGVSALGLGLGPSLDGVPRHLAEACHEFGLCLLVVPPAAAFLTTTKAYWKARSRDEGRELSDAMATHRALVNAMATADPVLTTMRTLSSALGVWVATLDAHGVVEQVFPAGRVRDAVRAAASIHDLDGSGVHSVATYPQDDEVVVVHPLPLEDRVVGYLAVGTTCPLSLAEHRLVTTTTALLSLQSVQRQRVDSASQARALVIATLLDLGLVEAAVRLTSRLGLAAVGGPVRVLVVRTSRAEEVANAVHRWSSLVLPGPVEGDRSWFVVPEGHPDLSTLERRLARADPASAAALSDLVRPQSVHEVRVGLGERTASAVPGLATSNQLHVSRIAWTDALQRLLDDPRESLVPSLAAYLRHRGQWDPAARELGVHRNTLRHRMNKAAEVMSVELDDPDVASGIWIYLRENGRA